MASRTSWQSREGLGSRLEHPRRARPPVEANSAKSGGGREPGRSGRRTDAPADNLTAGEGRTRGRPLVPVVVARVSARGPRPRRATRMSEPTWLVLGDRRVPLNQRTTAADSGRRGRLKPYSENRPYGILEGLQEIGQGGVLRHRQPKGAANGATVHLHYGACGLLDYPRMPKPILAICRSALYGLATTA